MQHDFCVLTKGFDKNLYWLQASYLLFQIVLRQPWIERVDFLSPQKGARQFDYSSNHHLQVFSSQNTCRILVHRYMILNQKWCFSVHTIRDSLLKSIMTYGWNKIQKLCIQWILTLWRRQPTRLVIVPFAEIQSVWFGVKVDTFHIEFKRDWWNCDSHYCIQSTKFFAFFTRIIA